MTRGQFDMFDQRAVDEASFLAANRNTRHGMMAETYREVKLSAQKKGFDPSNMPLHCEVRSAIFYLLAEPCVDVPSVVRKIGFLLEDDVTVQILDSHPGLLRILMSSLVSVKGVSGIALQAGSAFDLALSGGAEFTELLSLPCNKPGDVVSKAGLLLENADSILRDVTEVRALLSSFMHLKDA